MYWAKDADGNDYIVGCHHSQVAMEHVKWADEERWSACAAQCGGYLCAYVSALSYSCDDDFSVAIQDEVYHFVETLIQVIYLHEYCLCLILEATLGNVCILTHCFFLCLVVCAPHSSFPHEGKMPGVECAGDVR